tara:strand:+ start:448 stop:687 length:240 start_codon:yes stop_codon:yes gene_type:complete
VYRTVTIEIITTNICFELDKLKNKYSEITSEIRAFKKKLFNKREAGLFIDVKCSLNFIKLYEKKVVKKTNAISSQFTWI